MKKTIIVAMATALCLGTNITTNAKDKANAEQAAPVASPAEKKADTRKDFQPFRGVIASVDATAKTFTLKGEKAVTLKVTDTSKLTKAGQPVEFSTLAADDEIRGRAKKGTPPEVLTAKVGPLTPEEQAEKAAKAAKKAAKDATKVKPE
jgi:hypothetical protein